MTDRNVPFLFLSGKCLSRNNNHLFIILFIVFYVTLPVREFIFYTSQTIKAKKIKLIDVIHFMASSLYNVPICVI